MSIPIVQQKETEPPIEFKLSDLWCERGISLPYDVWVEILKFVPAISLVCRWSRVCKTSWTLSWDLKIWEVFQKRFDFKGPLSRSNLPRLRKEALEFEVWSQPEFIGVEEVDLKEVKKLSLETLIDTKPSSLSQSLSESLSQETLEPTQQEEEKEFTWQGRFRDLTISMEKETFQVFDKQGNAIRPLYFNTISHEPIDSIEQVGNKILIQAHRQLYLADWSLTLTSLSKQCTRYTVFHRYVIVEQPHEPAVFKLSSNQEKIRTAVVEFSSQNSFGDSSQGSCGSIPEAL